MLYDASRVINFVPAWFESDFWGRQSALEGLEQGRAAVHIFRHAQRRYVLRHYRRGGVFGKVGGDQYIWRGERAARPFVEWRLMYHLHRAGLPVPAPIAARVRKIGPLYTGDLITEFLPETRSLAQRLADSVCDLAVWQSIGRCLRRFHDGGVDHADLNAHNILVGADCAIYLIDFDRGRLRKPGLWCDANLARLRRSLEKIAYGLPPEHFDETAWHALLGAYLR
jgi:3-deoxy-D-manno-octulosonic acid kinase